MIETSRNKLKLETKLLINDLLPFWEGGFFKRNVDKGKETPGEEVTPIYFDKEMCDPLKEKAFYTHFPRISHFLIRKTNWGLCLLCTYNIVFGRGTIMCDKE